MHPFRFGISTPPATNRAEWLAAVRRIEDLGFDTLSVYDHLTQAFDPLISLAIAAEATDSLRLGTLVLNNDLRHPALLAREAASLAISAAGASNWASARGTRSTNMSRSEPLSTPHRRE